ncbi:GDSL-type esterase/lipase family protein [Micromonospora cathayae]|uniref:GDSL-type esterase/lipase family protein n=1 Tax=Micromonospora cathayae TaxID=3028804 RepID=A0ABY7ZIM2_9ACTN|nr:GDSL-type esterase/lipase family protein [Micromonospora sp. HUAS 3]WDZ82122.1 GDSL-type esterase/lipase family protein [Micromonospora sp. HUAS 3]
MPRRWIAAVASLSALVALACEGGGTGGGDGTPPPPRESPRPGTPAAMAAIGDSITTGFGTCLVLSSCHRNSWSTGEGRRVESHYRRLRELNPAIQGRAYNHASAGARASALPDQATRAVRDKADYVTVLIGANDACRGSVEAMTSVGTFREQVDRALRTLREGRPKARVLVVSIPDLHRLWEIGHRDERAVRAWGRGICPALLAAPTSTAPADRARRAAFRDRVDAYNEQLVAACRAYGSRCRHDGGAAHRVRFTLDEVNSLDYFHPNNAGQQRLAEVTWSAAGYAD